MVAGILLVGAGLVAGGVGGYLYGKGETVAQLKTQLGVLEADAKADALVVIAKLKALF
jgi:hypothetical protein